MTLTALDANWDLASSNAGATLDPAQLVWSAAQVPGTAASAMRSNGHWSFQRQRNFDAEDWWYRCHFSASSPKTAASRTFLRFEGLATLAEVRLNDQPLLETNNMFRAYEVDVSALLRSENELLIRFRSLDAELHRKRPRPRWRTKLVEKQQLRYIRTTLIGRMPAWSPPVAPVGPWRGVWLEERRLATVTVQRLECRVDGTRGYVEVVAEVEPHSDANPPTRAKLTVGDATAELHLHRVENGTYRIEGELQLDEVELWWPHTHGGQPLYAAGLSLYSGDECLALTLGKLGFRTLEAETADDGFGLTLNGVPMFARGACWTTTDVVRLTSEACNYREALATARAAGMNMLRVGGTHFYEADAFYDLCDELGILVWQDFMFANMDYPGDDAAFVAEVEEEATQILRRLARRPSLAVLCGGSEVAQQSAMLGLPRGTWSSPLFSQVLPSICERFAPGVTYLPSTPTGGTLPFQVDQGVSHYYGVGAYLRPLEDARLANVRFASECLAFSNIPEDSTIEQVMPGGQPVVHHPAWKERVPRDAGSSWDFEDVRDHYFKVLFGVDALSSRMLDPERYLARSRIVPGELMAATIAEWRRAESSCRGGLVWFFRDHWPGAGWGVVDSEGLPKASYYYLRRAFSSVALFFADEGLNGLKIHALNDSAERLDAHLTFTAWKDGELKVLEAATDLSIPARGQLQIGADQMLERFADTTYAYRFGPPSYAVGAAQLQDAYSGKSLSTAFYFPTGWALPVEDLGLEGTLCKRDEGAVLLQLRTRRFAQSVRINVPGYAPEDNYFHLLPGAELCMRLEARSVQRRLGGTVEALNGSEPVRLAVIQAEGVK